MDALQILSGITGHTGYLPFIFIIREEQCISPLICSALSNREAIAAGGLLLGIVHDQRQSAGPNPVGMGTVVLEHRHSSFIVVELDIGVPALMAVPAKKPRLRLGPCFPGIRTESILDRPMPATKQLAISELGDGAVRSRQDPHRRGPRPASITADGTIKSRPEFVRNLFLLDHPVLRPHHEHQTAVTEFGHGRFREHQALLSVGLAHHAEFPGATLVTASEHAARQPYAVHVIR